MNWTMNTLQIECFLSVAKNHSFSGAARERYISQPTISKHIRNLEEELGVHLFRREYMCVSLTEAGEVYYRLFSDFMEGLRQARISTNQMDEHTAGNIRLGLLYGWNLPMPLIQGLEDLQSHFPNISISVENHGFKDLISRLNNGMLDACIHLQDFLSLVDNIETIYLLDVAKYVVYSPRLAPAGKQFPAPTDFQQCTYYCVAEQTRSPVAQRMIQYCSYYRFSPKVAFQPNIESVLSNVAFGNGVTILDGFTKIESGENLRKLELYPPHKVSMAWLKTSANSLLPLIANELACYFRRTGAINL